MSTDSSTEPVDAALFWPPPVTAGPVTRGPAVADVMARWPVVDGDDRPEPGTGYAVAVDGRRPVALWLRDGRFDRIVPVTLRVLADDDPRRVLARAMDRPARCRFHPVVCVDGSGDLAGVLTIEALVRHVAG